MKSRFLRCNCKLPLNIQFFAEGDDDGGDGGGSGTENKTVSFDEFLQQGDNQAEFDRRTQKAINTAVTNAQEKWRALTDDKLSEAEKLAKMTKEEKAEYLQNKREKELSDRETEITRKELAAEAKNTLAEKGLPVELSEMLDYKDADSCNASISKMEKVFNKAVEAAVEEKLKGGKPPKKAPGEGDKDLEAQVLSLMSGR